MPNLVKCYVEGEYYARPKSGAGLTTKPYSIEVFIREEDVPKGPLHIVKKFLLDKTLRAQFKDYKRFRTHKLLKVEYQDEQKQSRQQQTNILTMDEQGLRDYCEELDLPVEFELFLDINELRNAIKMAKEDPEKFKIHQDAIREQRGEDLATEKALAAANEVTEEDIANAL